MGQAPWLWIPHIDFVSLQAKDGSTLAFVVRDHHACDPQMAGWRLPDVMSVLDVTSNPNKYPLMTNWKSPDGKLYTVFAARMVGGIGERAIGVGSFRYLQDHSAAGKAKNRATTDIVMWSDEGGPKPVLIGVSDPALAPGLKKKLLIPGTLLNRAEIHTFWRMWKAFTRMPQMPSLASYR